MQNWRDREILWRASVLTYEDTAERPVMRPNDIVEETTLTDPGNSPDVGAYRDNLVGFIEASNIWRYKMCRWECYHEHPEYGHPPPHHAGENFTAYARRLARWSALRSDELNH